MGPNAQDYCAYGRTRASDRPDTLVSARERVKGDQLTISQLPKVTNSFLRLPLP